MRTLLIDNGFLADFADYGSDTYEDLRDLADNLGLKVDTFIANTYGPNQDGAQVDIVAHSMGGLVTRAWIVGLGRRPYKNQIRRLVMAATPNYGTPFNAFESSFLLTCPAKYDVRSLQAEQMHYGHEFLWNLDQKWRQTAFARNASDVLAIVGTDEACANKLKCQRDGVVKLPASAALPELPDNRIVYVAKEHTSLDPFFTTNGIVNVDAKHPTWKLVKSFLLDSPPDCPDDCMKVPQTTTGMALLRFFDIGTKQPITWTLPYPQWAIYDTVYDDESCTALRRARSLIDPNDVDPESMQRTITLQKLAPGCHLIEVPAPPGGRY